MTSPLRDLEPTVGDPDRWSTVLQLLHRATADRVAPAAALCVHTDEGVELLAELGHAELVPRRIGVRRDQPFDLASITKVVGTTLLCEALVRAGLLDIAEPLSDVLPGAPAGVCVHHCLSHTSGYPAWRRLFDEAEAEQLAWGTSDTRDTLLQRAYTRPLQAVPGERHRYSDVGMMALCAYLERSFGSRFDVLWQRYVGDPSGLDLRFGWPGAAATEACPLRKRVVCGEVHDLNCAVLGGISTHAGLFGCAREVARAGRLALERYRSEDPTTKAFWTHRAAGSHHLGWDGVTPGASSAGPRWPLDGVGHLGFTGGSLWIAPRAGVVVALLTNRVHPVLEGGAVPGAPLARRTAAFRALRPAVHTAVADVLGQDGRWSGLSLGAGGGAR